MDGDKLALGTIAVLALGGITRKRGSREILGPMRFVRGKGSVPGPTPSLETVLRAVREANADPERIVLYHSGDASIAQKVHREGLSPHMGQWVRQVLEGATDDPDLIEQLAAGQAISYLSDTPDWVEVKASRTTDQAYAGPSRASETEKAKLIEEHGHLAIFILDRDDQSVIRARPEVQAWMDEDRYENLEGLPMAWWETPLYQQADLYTGEGGRKEPPFGIEPGDYITADPLSPDYTLTHRELLRFLDAMKISERGSKAKGTLEVVRVTPIQAGFAGAHMMRSMARGRAHDPHQTVRVEVVITGTPDELMSEAARTLSIQAARRHLFATWSQRVSDIHHDYQGRPVVRFEVQ